MATGLEILSFVGTFSTYFAIVFFVIGNIGNIINLLVLTTSKPFRSNQCAFYLIVESIVSICLLSTIFTSYIVQPINGLNHENIATVWCKLANSLSQIFRLISTTMVCFAALDQFFSTNPKVSIRQMSTVQLSLRLIFVSICLWTTHTMSLIVKHTVFFIK
jgi:hypothetical protein